MKHSLAVTVIILVIFLLAQYFGIAIIYSYIDQQQSTSEVTVFKDLPLMERPELDERTSFFPLVVAILIGTALFLFFARRNWILIMRLWFLLAITISMMVVFGIFINPLAALVSALAIGVWKVFKPNFWVQNLTELIIYGGLAAILVPVFNLLSVSVLLLIMSVYDAYAVWKSKHMVDLAKSQINSKFFAGLLIPYGIKKKAVKKIGSKISVKKIENKTKDSRVAVLGGGDLFLPLVFTGVVLKELGLLSSLIMPLFSVLGLAYLLWKGQEKKFYPAMPFISAGCFLGLGVVWLLI